MIFLLLGIVFALFTTVYAQSLPSVARFGPVRILYQNDLSTNYSTPALLLSKQVTLANATQACQAYSEQLLTTVSADIQDQLRYLTFSGELSNSTRLWIGNSSTTQPPAYNVPARFVKRAQCSAWSVSNASVVSVDCSAQLPSLCTSSQAPYNATAIASAPSNSSLVALQANQTSVIGFRDARSFRFLGIPFAQPPIGDLRFQAAQPLNTTQANITAVSYKHNCLQTPNNLTARADTLSEDCLYLNVYTPSLGDSWKLPVAVFIYGGAFTSGTGAIPIYDGGNLVSRGDIVVVTLNYRLGALGFLASPNLLNGSQGITDQIEALKWVQQNIGNYGGDSSKVTIFGESAGAQSVWALLSSSAAKGLFQAAIAESAPLGTPWLLRNSWLPVDVALANATNCASSTEEAAVLACLRQVNATDFYSDQVLNATIDAAAYANSQFIVGSAASLGKIEPFLPTINKASGVIDDQLKYLLGNGTLPGRGIPLLAGNTRNEAGLFVPAFAPQPLPNNNTVYMGAVAQLFGNSTAAAAFHNASLFPLNASDSDGTRNAIGQLLTLQSWQCPLQDLLNISVTQNTFSSLYSYRFDRGVPPTSSGFPEGCTVNATDGIDEVCHEEDLSEVFGSSNVLGLAYDANNNLTYNQYIIDTWISFFRTYSPNPTSDYLTARGRSYESTAAFVQQVPLQRYDPSSATAIHHFDLPPSSSGVVYQPQCQALQNVLHYNAIDNSALD